MASDELRELARRFPDGFVERKDGNDYVAHHIVNQRLLSVTGPFDFELVEVIRGDIPPRAPDSTAKSRRGRAGTPALSGIVTGGVWRLSVTIDGRTVRIEEVGDVGDVHNWPHDGARLKDAASDALKRCAMRLGLGLHLWAQERYFLDRQLDENAKADAEQETAARAQQAEADAELTAEADVLADEPPADVVPSDEEIGMGDGTVVNTATGELRQAQPLEDPTVGLDGKPRLPDGLNPLDIPSMTAIVANAGVTSAKHLANRIEKREPEWLAEQARAFGYTGPGHAGWLLSMARNNVIFRLRLARLVAGRAEVWKQLHEQEAHADAT
jgi:hypothetical protein